MQRKKQVAVILQLFQHYDRGILSGISAYARETMNWSIYVEEETPQRIPDLREWDGDGVILSFDDPHVVRATQKLKQPMVGIGGGKGWYDPATRIPYIGTDDRAIGRMAAEHLLARGLTRFAFCGFPPSRTNAWAQNRASAFMECLADAGYPCEVYTGRHTTSRSWERVQQELVEWLRTLKPPIGLMGCYDSRARHVLQACNFLKLRVPDDVAVIGVDNNILTCELADPPLTSVEQGSFRIGYTAAKILDQMIQGNPPDQPLHLIEPVGVVKRQSTNVLNVADKTVAAALRLIRDQASQGLQANAVAEHLNLSRSTLDQRFKQMIGRTIDQEIRRTRMSRAKELLARTQLPLREVAKLTGYGNEQYLTRVVREATQLTPAAYRKNHQARPQA